MNFVFFSHIKNGTNKPRTAPPPIVSPDPQAVLLPPWQGGERAIYNRGWGGDRGSAVTIGYRFVSKKAKQRVSPSTGKVVRQNEEDDVCVCSTNLRTKAESQQIVAQRPLSCVQYLVLYLSRIQRICLS